MTTMHSRQRRRDADARGADHQPSDMDAAAGVIRAAIWGLLIWVAVAFAVCLALA